MIFNKHAPIAFDLHKASASALAAARLFYFSPYADKSATAQNKKASQRMLKSFVARTGFEPVSPP